MPKIGLPSRYLGSPDHKRSQSFEYGSMPNTQIGLPSHYPGSPDHKRSQSFEYGVLLEELQDFDDDYRRGQLYSSTNSLNLVYSEDSKDKDNNDGNDNDNDNEREKSSLSIFQSDSNGRDNDDLIDEWIPKTITIPTTIS